MNEINILNFPEENTSQKSITESSLRTLGVVAALSFLTACSGSAVDSKSVVPGQEELVMTEVESLTSEIEDLRSDLDSLREEIDFLTAVNGIDQETIEDHNNRDPLPEALEAFPGELAEQQDDATLHLISFTSVIDGDDTIPGNTISAHGCNVVKVGDNIVSTAAHCVRGSILSGEESTQMKGGGEMNKPNSWTSRSIYFISDKPTISYDEALESGVRVTGYDEHAFIGYGDGAIMQLEVEGSGSEWFSNIESLPQRSDRPQKGELVRVSGHTPAGDQGLQQISSEGIVLGDVPGSIFGHNFSEDFLMVGIPLDEENKFSCNHGASGSALMDMNGEAFGTLAYVGRSENPSEFSADVVPSPQQVLQVEELVDTQLLGGDYILCGYSSTTHLEPAPLIFDTSSYTVDSTVKGGG